MTLKSCIRQLIYRKQRPTNLSIGVNEQNFDNSSKILNLILNEAGDYGAFSFEIVINKGLTATYRFLTNTNHQAIGKINPKAVDQIVKCLEHSTMIGCITLYTEDGSSNILKVSRIFEASDNKVFAIKLCTDSQEDFSQSKFPIEGPEVAREQNEITYSERAGSVDIMTPLTQSSFPKEERETEDNHRILLIEDNQVFAHVLERFFLKQGISSSHVRNGKEAISYLTGSSPKPDLIVCDLHMPEMNGLEFLRKFRSEPIFPEIPVVMLTSDSDVEVELQLLTDGADIFVSKNEDPRLLCVKIKKLLEKTFQRAA